MKSNITSGLPTLTRWTATVCALALFASVAARAQDSFKIGPFGVRSQVSSSVNWTDNVNNTKLNTEDDYWFTVSTNHHAATRLYDRHDFFLSTGFGTKQHPERKDLNSVTPINLTTGLNLNYDKYKFRFADTFSYQSQASDQLFAAGTARVDTFSNTFVADAAATLRPWGFGLKYLHSNTWYGTTNGQNAFNPEPSSRDLINADVDYSMRVWRGLTGVVGLAYVINWNNGEETESLRGKIGVSGPLTPNLDLDAVAHFAITGTTYYRATMTYRSGLARKLRYSIKAGALVTESLVSSKKVVSLILTTNITLDSQLEFPPRTTHAFDFNVSPRDVTVHDQAEGGVSFSERISATYRIAHRLTDRITLNPFFRFTRQRTFGATTNETVEFFTAGMGTGYQLTRKFSLGANYSYISRNSNLGADREYDRNTVSLSGTYVF